MIGNMPDVPLLLNVTSFRLMRDSMGKGGRRAELSAHFKITSGGKFRQHFISCMALFAPQESDSIKAKKLKKNLQS
jgi:hypothetical protein